MHDFMTQAPVLEKAVTKLTKWAGALLLSSLCAGTSLGATEAKKLAPWVGVDFGGKLCQGKSLNYGPYDYMQRGALPDGTLRVVEQRHFTPSIEQLVDGPTTLPDIDYTLRAWPNHHRALFSMIRSISMPDIELGQKRIGPPECYLQRAINFSPNDAMARMLFGVYLQNKKRYEEALKLYRSAELIEPENLQIKYNLGLVLSNLKQYDEALKYANDVYARGFPLPGLRNNLKVAGYTVSGGKSSTATDQAK
ncbi:MAG: CDC27 family protein [Parahaliea sp.]